MHKGIALGFAFSAITMLSLSSVSLLSGETETEAFVQAPAIPFIESAKDLQTAASYPQFVTMEWSAPFGLGRSALDTEEPTDDSGIVRTSEKLQVAPKIPSQAEKYVIAYNGDITFTGGEWIYPQTSSAMYRAISSVGNAIRVCVDGKCFNKCDHLAGDIWGYEYASGYLSAATHWATAKRQGIARTNDREPPLGALLFWDTGRVFGHVATYIGNGMVVTNSGGEYGSDIYIAYADAYETYGWKYLGWADPVFFNEDPGSALR